VPARGAPASPGCARARSAAAQRRAQPAPPARCPDAHWGAVAHPLRQKTGHACLALASGPGPALCRRGPSAEHSCPALAEAGPAGGRAAGRLQARARAPLLLQQHGRDGRVHAAGQRDRHSATRQAAAMAPRRPARRRRGARRPQSLSCRRARCRPGTAARVGRRRHTRCRRSEPGAGRCRMLRRRRRAAAAPGRLRGRARASGRRGCRLLGRLRRAHALRASGAGTRRPGALQRPGGTRCGARPHRRAELRRPPAGAVTRPCRRRPRAALRRPAAPRPAARTAAGAACARRPSRPAPGTCARGGSPAPVSSARHPLPAGQASVEAGGRRQPRRAPRGAPVDEAEQARGEHEQERYVRHERGRGLRRQRQQHAERCDAAQQRRVQQQDGRGLRARAGGWSSRRSARGDRRRAGGERRGRGAHVHAGSERADQNVLHPPTGRRCHQPARPRRPSRSPAGL